eukprot:gene16132-7493_t
MFIDIPQLMVEKSSNPFLRQAKNQAESLRGSREKNEESASIAHWPDLPQKQQCGRYQIDENKVEKPRQMLGINLTELPKTERGNQRLRTLMAEDIEPTNWNLLIDPVQFSIGISRNASTNMTPFKMMYGREARRPIEINEDDKDVAGAL